MRCNLWKLHQNPKKNKYRFIIRITIMRIIIIIIIINIYIINIITCLHYILILIVNIRRYVMWLWRTWWWISGSYSLFHDRELWSHLTSSNVTLLVIVFYLLCLKLIYFIKYIYLMLYIYTHIYNIIMII